MVLAELGQKIGQALNKISAKATVSDDDVKELLNDIARALLQADVNIHQVKKLQQSIKSEIALSDDAAGFQKRKIVQSAVFNGIKQMLDPGVKPFYPTKGRTNVVMFVGLQGSGKTTSCTKYGAYYQRRGFKTALVCADTFRAGAYDQLRQNATKAKLRFYGSLTEADPVAIAREGVAELRREKYDLIIVDTSGRHRQESALFEEMAQVQQAVQPNDIVFVMSATDGQGVEEQAKNFKSKVPVGSVIVTKLDSSNTKGGGALSAVAATKSPIVFIGTGEHFDDFDLFKPDGFVKKMLGMGDLGGLLETMREANVGDSNSALYKRAENGQFTLRDMYEHLQNVQRMGSVGKIMEMIPGMSALGGAAGQQGDMALKAFVQIMDSMTPAELDCTTVKKTFTPQRMHRIARGSGHNVIEVQALLTNYQNMEEMVKRVGKLNFKSMTSGGGGGGLGGNAMNQQQMGQIAKLLNPNVLRQMGGMGGLQGMMKQLGALGGAGGGGGGRGGAPGAAGAGGMPDMGAMMDMMKMMQGGAGGGMPGMPGPSPGKRR